MLSYKSVSGLLKPLYFFQPLQVVKRVWRGIHRSSQARDFVRLPWGLIIAVNTQETISHALLGQGVYEAVVTETIWRLAEPNDVAVDVGSHIGYMASALAVRVGREGTVHCFEPHPEVFADLRENVRTWERDERCSAFVLHQAAAGECEGTAELHVPPYFAANRGTSWIGPDNPKEMEGSRETVSVETLDGALGKHGRIGIVKIDVEGHELAVLRGMSHILDGRRAKHIVFEEVRDFPAETHKYLMSKGYAVFGLEARFLGLRCVPDGPPRFDPINGPPPNYLATVEPERAIPRLQRPLWRSFGLGRVLGMSL